MKRILVADDEEQILSVMMDVLEGAGYEVVGAHDGVEALKLLENQSFDVALLDVMMPKLSGYHLTTKVLGLANPPKVIIVTARNYEKDEKTLRSVGAHAFLPKPFSNKDLLDVVSRLTK
ncbi:hypothetical protein BVX98_01920 [bacterium F11]|nr:hypothetical protein BVX98_01920 [bacterium F11]